MLLARSTDFRFRPLTVNELFSLLPSRRGFTRWLRTEARIPLSVFTSWCALEQAAVLTLYVRTVLAVTSTSEQVGSLKLSDMGVAPSRRQLRRIDR